MPHRFLSSGFAITEAVDEANSYYSANRIAEIAPVEGRTLGLFRDTSGKVSITSPQIVDGVYRGCLSNGRCVCFAASDIDEECIRMDLLPLHLQNSLSRFSALRASCFVLAAMPSGSCYRIPLGVWVNMPGIYRRSYMLESDIRQYLVQSHCGILDYLNALQERTGNT